MTTIPAANDAADQDPLAGLPVESVSTDILPSSPQKPGAGATTEGGDDPLAGLPVESVETSPAEKAGAFGRSATRGAVTTTAPVAGMVMGASIGALAGPAAPIAVPAGAAVGLGAGYLFGEGLSDILGLPRVNELPPNLRPYAVAGETFGTGLPIAAAPVAAARFGARLPSSTVGNYLNRIIDTAARSPGAVAFAETSALATAAVGGGVAEAQFPGEPIPRFVGEVAGGFFSPARIVTGAGRAGFDVVQRAMQRLSPAARKTKAGQIMQEILEASGEDPAVVAQLLRQSGLPGLGPQTAAQKTGSPALAAMEASLAKENARFGADAEKMATGTLDFIESAMIALRGTGDPAALIAAARLQQTRFRLLLNNRLQGAEREAAEAAAKITQDTPAARAELSKTANAALQDAMKMAREAESELWNAIPRDIPAGAQTIIGKLDEIKSQLLPREKLPDVAEGTVQDIVARQGRTTSGELILFRSRMLALAREADGQGRMNDARIFGELAEAAIDDLDRMATNPRFGAYGRTAEGYEAARTFSRELHDTFTRTFAGQALARNARGASRIPPELMLRRALGSGEEAAALRFHEIEEATRFMAQRSVPGSLENTRAEMNVDAVLDAQERLLRLTAAEAIDPNTGRVSAPRLLKVMRDNGELMDRFPEVRNSLEAAAKGENRRADIERMVKGVSRVADHQAAFAKVGKFENASDAVRAAVAQGNKAPLESVMNLVKVAKRGGQDAIDGLKASVWEHAARQASDADGNIDLAKLGKALFDPIRPDQPSLFDIMVKEGIAKGSDRTKAVRLLEEAAKVTRVMEAGPTAEALEDLPGALTELVIRVAGARFGSAMSKFGPAGAVSSGPSLIAAGRGSETFRNIFEKVPNAKIKDVLIEAARDPSFAAKLLEKPRTAGEAFRLGRQIHAYLFAAGLTTEPSPE